MAIMPSKVNMLLPMVTRCLLADVSGERRGIPDA